MYCGPRDTFVSSSLSSWDEMSACNLELNHDLFLLSFESNATAELSIVALFVF